MEQKSASYIGPLILILIIGLGVTFTYAQFVYLPSLNVVKEFNITQTLEIELAEFSIIPEEASLNEGDGLRIIITNNGEIDHDFAIQSLDIQVPLIAPGDTITIDILLEETGSFEFICTIAGHKELGMTGTIIVNDPGH